MVTSLAIWPAGAEVETWPGQEPWRPQPVLELEDWARVPDGEEALPPSRNPVGREESTESFKAEREAVEKERLENEPNPLMLPLSPVSDVVRRRRKERTRAYRAGALPASGRMCSASAPSVPAAPASPAARVSHPRT